MGKKSQLGTKLPLPSIITLSQMMVSKVTNESAPVLGVDRLPLQSPGGSKTNLNLTKAVWIWTEIWELVLGIGIKWMMGSQGKSE